MDSAFGEDGHRVAGASILGLVFEATISISPEYLEANGRLMTRSVRLLCDSGLQALP